MGRKMDQDMAPANDGQAVTRACRACPSTRAATAVSRRFAMGLIYGAGTTTGSLAVTAIVWWMSTR